MIDGYLTLKEEEVLTFEQAPHPVEYTMYYSVQSTHLIAQILLGLGNQVLKIEMPAVLVMEMKQIEDQQKRQYEFSNT